MAKQKMNVQGTEIALFATSDLDYISLTDIAKKFGDARLLIRNWMRNTSTLNYLAQWERLHNPNFKEAGFGLFKNEILEKPNTFNISPERWIKETAATGMVTKRGRYGGGTYAQSDITLNYCYWLNPIFQLYLIKEFQRLKEEEAKRLDKKWNLRRELSKSNYHIHTDAVREHLVPLLDWHTKQEKIRFASEADLINLVVFGMTAKEWRIINPTTTGNIRDKATEIELQVLSNIESNNALLIEQGYTKDERLSVLTSRASREKLILEDAKADEKLKQLK